MSHIIFGTKTAGRRFPLGRLLICVVLSCGLAIAAGCKDDNDAADASGGVTAEEAQGEWGEHLLEFAVNNLQRLDEFQTGEMRQQVIDRLNQWIRAKSAPSDWEVDPLVAGLPKPLRELPAVKNLGKMEFSRYDGLVLQEDVWFRDVSNWSRGDRLDDLQRAKRLFDWTVRNIQLEKSSFAGKAQAPQWPWETILTGQGTAEDRAWVFALLARQQEIDAVLLALPSKDDALQIWTVGVLERDKLYLFDPKLGLPIPGLEGVKFNDDGSDNGMELDITPATLAEAAKDDKLLRRLGAEKDKPYPFKSSNLNKVVALIVASPASLSARMAMVENKLAGDQRVVLTADPNGVAERLKAVKGLSGARLWQRPFETMLKRDGLDQQQQKQIDSALAAFDIGGVRPLWRGRTLYLKGRFTGEDNATTYLQKARPPNRKLVVLQKELMESGDWSKEDLDAKMAAYRRAKQDATYWLGLVAAMVDGDRQSAIDYFDNRTLKTWPNGPWTSAAKYNLARTYESAGELKQAIGWLKADADSPAAAGNLLRAKWLEDRIAAQKAKAEQQRKASKTTLPVLPQ
ncbi:MAG: hypothetical protein U9N87_01670 [Planctomycetota bacterium]|nr:hypothetical protein [Planctomycetota bacterium]